MESSNPTEVEQLVWKKIFASFAQMRNEGHNTDVTLICGGKEFLAHKIILEASCPYFSSMFASEMVEAKSGKVVFDWMEPDTLEAVLNFIYCGDVSTMNTEQSVTNVLEVAHMIQMNDLTEFCFKQLARFVHTDNTVDLWKVSCLYDCMVLKDNVLEFVLGNLEVLPDLKVMEEVEYAEIIEFVTLAVNRGVCLDGVLHGVLGWLICDLPAREKFIPELFAYFDPHFLSHTYFKMLLQDKNLMTLSPELSHRMNQLGIDTLVFSQGGKCRDTIRCVVPGFSNIETDWRSSRRVIQNLPWNILIRPTGKPGEKRSIGFYVECNYRFMREGDWSCKAVVKFKLVNRKDDLRHIVHKIPEKLFCASSPNWGIREFVQFGIPFNPLDDFIINDTAVFEVEIQTVIGSRN